MTVIYPIGEVVLLIDNILKIIVITFIFTANVIATERPEVVKKLTDKNHSNQSITIIENLTDEEKIFYWKNKSKKSDDVIETTATYEYLNLVDAMFAISIKKADALSNRFSKQIQIQNITSELVESPNRSSYFFEKQSDGIIMLTIWDFEADGSKIILINDFINTKFLDVIGSLVLIKNDNLLNKVLWKLNVINKNIQYELYVPDTIDSSGRTKLQKNDILDLMRKTIVFE